MLDHETDGTEVTIETQHVIGNSGANPQVCRTTKGWKLLELWRDGPLTWVAPKDLKESNPVEVAEHD